MEEVFPVLRAMGASGLLVEYEDMFPYSGLLKNLTAKNHYTPSEIKRLLDAADRNKLNVIPLVQTFGHLGLALKLPDYMALRSELFPPKLCLVFLRRTTAQNRSRISERTLRTLKSYAHHSILRRS